MEQQKKFLTPWKIFGIIFALILLWFIIKIILPLGETVVQLETTRNTLSRSAAGAYLDVEAPAKLGKSIHINSVDMPEPGFIVIYRQDRYTNNGHETYKVFGSSPLLPKGKKEGFDILLTEEVKCTNLTARLYRDLNNNGKFDLLTEGEEAPTNRNGEARIPDPTSTVAPSTTILQTFDVKCR